MPFGDPKGGFESNYGYGGMPGTTTGMAQGGGAGTGNPQIGAQGKYQHDALAATGQLPASRNGYNDPGKYTPGQPLPMAKPKQLAAALGNPTPTPTPTPTPAPQPGFGVPDPMQQAWSNVGSNYPGRLPGISGIVTGDMGTGYGPYGRDFSNPVSNVGAKGDYQGGGIAIGRR